MGGVHWAPSREIRQRAKSTEAVARDENRSPWVVASEGANSLEKARFRNFYYAYIQEKIANDGKIKSDESSKTLRRKRAFSEVSSI